MTNVPKQFFFKSTKMSHELLTIQSLQISSSLQKLENYFVVKINRYS